MWAIGFSHSSIRLAARLLSGPFAGRWAVQTAPGAVAWIVGFPRSVGAGALIFEVLGDITYGQVLAWGIPD